GENLAPQLWEHCARVALQMNQQPIAAELGAKDEGFGRLAAPAEIVITSDADNFAGLILDDDCPPYGFLLRPQLLGQRFVHDDGAPPFLKVLVCEAAAA